MSQRYVFTTLKQLDFELNHQILKPLNRNKNYHTINEVFERSIRWARRYDPNFENDFNLEMLSDIDQVKAEMKILEAQKKAAEALGTIPARVAQSRTSVSSLEGQLKAWQEKLELLEASEKKAAEEKASNPSSHLTVLLKVSKTEKPKKTKAKKKKKKQSAGAGRESSSIEESKQEASKQEAPAEASKITNTKEPESAAKTLIQETTPSSDEKIKNVSIRTITVELMAVETKAVETHARFGTRVCKALCSFFTSRASSPAKITPSVQSSSLSKKSA